VIALIVPNLTNPMFPYWSHEILEVAASEGFEVLVVATDDDPARLEAAARTLVNRNIDGAIVLASHREDATALLTLREERIPFTFLSRRSEYVSADFVGIDDYTASRQLAQHVVSHQPQRPATVVGPRFSTASAQREKGMNDALSNARLHVPSERRTPPTSRALAVTAPPGTSWHSLNARTRSCAEVTRSVWVSWRHSQRTGSKRGAT
jgi:LacI family transcriptional regulator